MLPVEDSRPSATVRSVERCIDIIEVLARRDVPMNLSDISRAIATPKSTTLTILRTLVQRGLVAMDPVAKAYRMGLGFSRFTPSKPPRVDLIGLATPVLEALARETLETATIALCENDRIYNVCRFVGPQPLQLIVPIGIPRDLYATAGGKVFLAWMTESQRRDFFDTHSLRRLTPRTITDPAALIRQLGTIRRSGYSITRGETSPELFGIAAPIFDASEAVRAVVNLSGPLFRLQPNRTRYANAVTRAAADISAEIARIGVEVDLPAATTVAAQFATQANAASLKEARDRG